MKIQNNFLKSTVNKDYDERLTPNGQLVDAQNFFVSSEDGSGAGVGKNVLGNVQKTTLGIVGGETIGSIADGSRDRIFYFHKGDNFDYVIEYVLPTDTATIVLQSTSGGILNFNLNNRITHIDIFESDEDSYLLSWTDGLNPPRVINIDRAKTYGVDGFTSAEISVIKAPPLINLVSTPKQTTQPTGSNFMEDRFLSFAYRYKYNDGYFSAISSFTEPIFVPSNFELDRNTGDNNGMINSANAVDLEFNVGSRDVIGVDLLFKETNSSTVYVIEKFNKSDEGWADNSSQTFEFNNSKIYLPLPESQYFRNFDNVPLTANAQAKTGNRLTYGDYVEGRDIDEAMDFSVTFEGEDVASLTYDTTIENGNYTPRTFSNIIDWESKTINSGTDNTNLDLATNVMTMTMAINSTLDFTIDVTLNSTDPSDTAKVIITDFGSQIASSSVFDTSISFAYQIDNTSGGATKDVELRFYVQKESGDVIYDCTMNVDYQIAAVTDYDFDYDAEYQESYLLNGTPALSGNIMNKGQFDVDFTDFDFSEGNFLFIDYEARSNLNEDASNIFAGLFYIIPEDYTDLTDFFTNSDFQDFMENESRTDGHSKYFRDNYIGANGTVDEFQGFRVSQVGNTLKFLLPYTRFEVTDALGTYDVEELYRLIIAEAYASFPGAFSSMHSNRDYEVAMIYMDEQGRKTTALTSKNNTVYIPNSNSITQNKLKVTVNHNPPDWASKYKFAIKQTKGNYETVYGTVFYVDGSFIWFKIIGGIKNKINEGDSLIVKRDSDGVVEGDNVVITKVLAVEDKPSDFIDGNNDESGTPITEEEGTYVKILPRDFTVNYDPESFINTRDISATSTDRPFSEVGISVWEVDTTGTAYVPPSVPDEIVKFDPITGVYTVKRALVTKGLSTYDKENDTIVHTEIPSGSSVRLLLRSVRQNRLAAVHEKVYYASTDYDNFEDFFNVEIQPNIPLDTNVVGEEYSNVSIVRGYAYYRDTIDDFVYPEGNRDFVEDPTGYIFLKAEGVYAGNGSVGGRKGRLSAFVDVRISNNFLVFETEPEEQIESPFYETPETYSISGGTHEFTDHLLSKAYNCFSFGNGVESYQVRDRFNEKNVTLNAIPTSVSEDEYKQINRYADLTYSGIYQPSTNVNSLNEFNLSQANFKDDIEKRYGKIIKLFPTETDLLVIQEDKWSKVLYGKDLLYNTDATTNLSRIAEVLGQQVMYGGEYGISTHPESFDKYSFNSYATDVNRGVVMRLNNSNGLSEISQFNMVDYFKELFRNNTIDNIIGEYDAFYDVYILNIKYTTPSLDSEYVTWLFSDKDKGFLTTTTFNPDDMVRLNNEFISFKNGDVYLHNRGAYNTFYGVREPSKFSFNFSQEPSMRKLFRNISIEGIDSWDIDLKTDLQNGFINKIDFDKKEGVWYAYVRGEENAVDLSTLSMQGVGQISEINGNILSFTSDVPNIVSVGDKIYNTSITEIGTITDKTNSTITMDTVVGLSVNDFVISSKPQSIETSGLLGYYMRVDAELDTENYTEVYAVNSEVSKSYE